MDQLCGLRRPCRERRGKLKPKLREWIVMPVGKHVGRLTRTRALVFLVCLVACQEHQQCRASSLRVWPQAQTSIDGWSWFTLSSDIGEGLRAKNLKIIDVEPLWRRGVAPAEIGHLRLLWRGSFFGMAMIEVAWNETSVRYERALMGEIAQREYIRRKSPDVETVIRNCVVAMSSGCAGATFEVPPLPPHLDGSRFTLEYRGGDEVHAIARRSPELNTEQRSLEGIGSCACGLMMLPSQGELGLFNEICVDMNRR